MVEEGKRAAREDKGAKLLCCSGEEGRRDVDGEGLIGDPWRFGEGSENGGEGFPFDFGEVLRVWIDGGKLGVDCRRIEAGAIGLLLRGAEREGFWEELGVRGWEP